VTNIITLCIYTMSHRRVDVNTQGHELGTSTAPKTSSNVLPATG
jgi:hypothetical protein